MLGRLLYQTWFRPLGWSRRVLRQGVRRSMAAARGEAAMRRAAHNLPRQSPTGDPHPTPVCFLTGARYWHLTMFCAWSLQRWTARPIRFELFDDGSLAAEIAARSCELFPGTIVHRRAELDAMLDRTMPGSAYPAIRARLAEYPHLRKLTDVHGGAQGWRLVLDSDMLFHREPTALLRWLDEPSAPIHMNDVGTHYGYSLPLMTELAGSAPPARVNVGVIGLRSEDLDWSRIDRWIEQLQRAEGTHYLQEQALTAMILAGREAKVLPEGDYRCAPDTPECKMPTLALHHYVNESRLDLYIHSWRLVLQ